jgi:hypothetical protein
MKLPTSIAMKALGMMCAAALLIGGGIARAGTSEDLAATDSSSSSDRYGLFGALDHRSNYGEGVFPEPFLVDDTDLESNESRVDWLTTGAPGLTTNEVKAEVEKGFGLVTFEIEVPYQWQNDGGNKTHGFGNIDIGARFPFFQYVSPSGLVNTTFGAALEVGVPTFSEVSQNTELVPKLFNDLQLGEHITLQSIAGYSMLYGPGEDGGLRSWEYGFVLGYTLQHKQLPIPGVRQLIPMLEIIDETTLNHDSPGTNLSGDIGFRANLKAIGAVQPRLGCAFVFPISQQARGDLHWGFVTSLVFQY